MMEQPNDNAPHSGQAGEASGKSSDQSILNLPDRQVKYPSPHHLPGRVLGILLTGAAITHKDSWLRFGHARLAATIWKIRNMGWPVECREEVVPTSDYGRKASIGIYSIHPLAIEQAGEIGQRYAADCARIEAERRAA